MDFAEKIGMSVKTVSNIENGAVDMKSSTIKKICDVLKTTPNHLMGYKSTNEEKIDKIKELANEILKLTGVNTALKP